MDIKCHEFFGCRREVECHFFNYEGEENCWEVDADLTPFVKDIKKEEKIALCENCLYYQHVQKNKV